MTKTFWLVLVLSSLVVLLFLGLSSYVMTAQIEETPTPRCTPTVEPYPPPPMSTRDPYPAPTPIGDELYFPLVMENC